MARQLGATLNEHLLRFVPPFAERFRSSWELFAMSERLIHEQSRDAMVTPRHGDSLLFGITGRAIKTYRSSLHLCALGHGPQAVMLNRSLIEGALIGNWISANVDEAFERLALHERQTAHIWRDVFEEHDLDLGALAHLPRLTEEDRAAMNAAFGPYGTRPWTGRNLHDIAEELADRWGDENETHLLRWIVRFHLRHANLAVHVTAASLARPSFPADRPPTYDAAESTEDVAGALLSGFWSYANTIRLVLEGEQCDELMALYREQMPTFFAE